MGCEILISSWFSCGFRGLHDDLIELWDMISQLVFQLFNIDSFGEFVCCALEL